jgi:hypothetical protein
MGNGQYSGVTSLLLYKQVRYFGVTLSVSKYEDQPSRNPQVATVNCNS